MRCPTISHQQKKKIIMNANGSGRCQLTGEGMARQLDRLLSKWSLCPEFFSFFPLLSPTPVVYQPCTTQIHGIIFKCCYIDYIHAHVCNTCVIYSHTYMYVCICLNMCVCEYILYTHIYSLVAHISNFLSRAEALGGCPFCVSLSTRVIPVQVLFRQPCC